MKDLQAAFTIITFTSFSVYLLHTFYLLMQTTATFLENLLRGEIITVVTLLLVGLLLMLLIPQMSFLYHLKVRRGKVAIKSKYFYIVFTMIHLFIIIGQITMMVNAARG